MSKQKTLFATAIIALFLATGYVVSIAEKGIDQRRQARIAKDDYWDCNVMPEQSVLRRVYIRRVIIDAYPNARQIHRSLLFVSLLPYISVRVGDEELADDFLKTPTRLERGCLPKEGQTL